MIKQPQTARDAVIISTMRGWSRPIIPLSKLFPLVNHALRGFLGTSRRSTHRMAGVSTDNQRKAWMARFAQVGTATF
jgi:hypothetical protein